MKEFEVIAKDELRISACILEHNNPKAIIQIVHGAKEHYRRYLDFAKYLNQNGYVVVLSDNRGHGHSVNETYPLGHMENIGELIEDQLLLEKEVRKEYPDLDLILFGHSFGTCIAINYLQENDSRIKKLLLSGTVYYHKGVNQAIAVGRGIAQKKGSKAYSKLIGKLGDIDGDKWVVKNPVALEKYKNDPLCKYKYTIGAILTVWESVSELKKFHKYKLRNKDLPIGLFSGREDPITGYDRGLKSSINNLNTIGYTNIQSKIYDDMKHEILNEIDNKKVYKDMLDFIEKD